MIVTLKKISFYFKINALLYRTIATIFRSSGRNAHSVSARRLLVFEVTFSTECASLESKIRSLPFIGFMSTYLELSSGKSVLQSGYILNAPPSFVKSQQSLQYNIYVNHLKFRRVFVSSSIELSLKQTAMPK
mmetsp:Transcript_35806/g.83424  ORF Transcript_35806/g.83424 Transcript_35806/m.83424 type:complete len:132 (+) Transcript_35806:923-1318(+)